MDLRSKHNINGMIFWIFLVAMGFMIFNISGSFNIRANEINYSNLLFQVNRENIGSITISNDGKISGTYKQGVNGSLLFKSHIHSDMVAEFIDKLTAIKNPPIIDIRNDSSYGFTGFLYFLLPTMLIIGFVMFFIRQQIQGGGAKMMQFGRSKARLSTDNKKKTFKDVAGQDEAKNELQEIIEFLKEPQKFQKLGGRIPKGVLLMGSPGTGKTLLARAVAGEANVSFFSISGSDFVEMFVGVGASRVRDLFEQGQKNAPCIIFIDELDAVGRHRGSGIGGGHDEREQTLNALLVEMDGFNANEGVIIVAATNRPDVLDPALLRPGRFDRRVIVHKPDIKGRKGILDVHTRKIPLDDNVKNDLEKIARGTAGFSGADIESLVNEAALNAARFNRKTVNMIDFEFAKDKVLMGSERRSMAISDEEKRITAIHEAGHALLAALLPNADPIHKVTIIPRGMALGLTQLLPIEEKYNSSEPYLRDQICVLLGGRVAEEIANNGIKTTGASNDLERVKDLARRMICEWGMSNKLGPMTFGKKEQEYTFLGHEITHNKDYSEETAIKIDNEIKELVDEAYSIAKNKINEHRIALNKIVSELLDNEVVDGERILEIVNSKES